MNNILIVGDFFPVQSNLSFFADGNVGELFDNEIIQLFTNTDYRACNLEGALTDSSIRMEKTGPVIVAPTKVVNAYKALGIDYCLLANNHITDARDQGVVDTMTRKYVYTMCAKQCTINHRPFMLVLGCTMSM